MSGEPRSSDLTASGVRRTTSPAQYSGIAMRHVTVRRSETCENARFRDGYRLAPSLRQIEACIHDLGGRGQVASAASGNELGQGNTRADIYMKAPERAMLNKAPERLVMPEPSHARAARRRSHNGARAALNRRQSEARLQSSTGPEPQRRPSGTRRRCGRCGRNGAKRRRSTTTAEDQPAKPCFGSNSHATDQRPNGSTCSPSLRT